MQGRGKDAQVWLDSFYARDAVHSARGAVLRKQKVLVLNADDLDRGMACCSMPLHESLTTNTSFCCAHSHVA